MKLLHKESRSWPSLRPFQHLRIGENEFPHTQRVLVQFLGELLGVEPKRPESAEMGFNPSAQRLFPNVFGLVGKISGVQRATTPYLNLLSVTEHIRNIVYVYAFVSPVEYKNYDGSRHK